MSATAARGRVSLAHVPRDGYLLGAIIALTAGTLAGFGEYTPAALALVLVGLALLTAALAGTASARSLPRLLWAGLLFVLVALGGLEVGPLPGVSWSLFLVAATAAAIGALVRDRLLSWALLGVAVGLEAVMLGLGWRWGSSPIDVFTMLQAGARQLIGGANPYSVLVPFTPYTGYRGPSAIPFNYGPAAAVIDVPGRLLGDVRIVHLVLAVVLVGCVAVLARHADAATRFRVLALASLLPLTLALIHYAWVDLPALAFFALWLTVRDRHAWGAAMALGVSLAIKPSAVPVLIPMVVWLPRARRDVVAGVAAAAVVIAPFAVITGPAAFFRDVVSNLADQPPRLNSLTVDAFLHSVSAPLLPGALSVAAVLVVAAVATFGRRPAGPGDCAVVGALIAVVAFLVAKVAYLNYYDTAVVFLVLALALGLRPSSEPVSAGVLERLLPRASRATYSGVRR